MDRRFFSAGEEKTILLSVFLFLLFGFCFFRLCDTIYIFLSACRGTFESVEKNTHMRNITNLALSSIIKIEHNDKGRAKIKVLREQGTTSATSVRTESIRQARKRATAEAGKYENIYIAVFIGYVPISPSTP